MPSRLPSEGARQRELYKYWQPHTSIFPQAEYDSTFNQNYQPQASYDAALTAYAQLGALRLNVKRGMISVVDKHFQYVIAESTRSLSLQHGTALDPDDQLWFGLRTIPRAMGICAAALGDFTILEAADEAAQSGNEYNHHYVINDLSKDPRFESQPFVCGTPYLRFYAGVPIRSPAGFLIGVYSIVDDKPRDDFGQAEIEILKDLAATVMDHFVLNTVRRQHTRSARMVKGLGLFVEGKSTLRDWFLSSGHLGNGPTAQDGSRGGWTLSDQADAEFGVEVSKLLPNDLAALKKSTSLIPPVKYDSGLSASIAQSEPNTQNDSTREATSMESTTTISLSNDPAYSPLKSTNPYAPRDSTIPLQSTAADKLINPHSSIVGDETPMLSASLNWEHQSASDTTELLQSTMPQDTRSLYLRASHLIRESLSVEGCAFLDANVTSFDNQPGRTTDSISLSNSPNSASMCEVLGVSIKNRVGEKYTEEQNVSFSANHMQRFLKRYPQGKVFYFEDDGAFSLSESDSDDDALKAGRTSLNLALRKSLKKSRQFKRHATEETDMSTLLDILPGIRCMAFFPLWDAETKRWSAAGLAWTKDPIRILDGDEDLAYLSAFCNNIMAEKARIDAQMADKVKGNFISSVSHEFRSPLHGILASAEHLQDMSLGAAQDELISMINSCSRMLMDTIDSILDFTKINNAKRPEKISSSAHFDSTDNASAPDLAAETSEIDLSVLTEEVVENILSGYNYGKAKLGESIAYSRQPSFEPGGDVVGRDVVQTCQVLILVSIDWRASWVFKTQAAAWRRILMNLFGNALKYTKSGQIRVSLQCQDTEPGKASDISSVTLSVSDTGRGISNEFLKNHLFTPFTQEDSLSPGTGLGLSIVRQLVDDLNGQIELKSKKDIGTEATVQVKFQNVSPLDAVFHGVDCLTAATKKPLQGLTACLVGFDIPDFEDPASGILSGEAARKLSLTSMLRKFLSEWCGMKVLKTNNLDAQVADVHILLEAEASALLGEASNEISLPDATSRVAELVGKSAILVLCSSSKSSNQATIEHKHPIALVQPPFGPYKLAKALDVLLKKKAEPQLATSVTISPATVATTNVVKLREQCLDPRPDPEPVVKHSTMASMAMSSHTIPIHPKRPTVLLVDDNEINLKLLIMYMRKIELPFETASNGLEALHKFQKNFSNIEIILMDISMPIMDGLTSTREIRKYEQENGLRPSTIIAVTGAASNQAQKEASISGVDRFLTKPVPLKILRGWIEEWESKNGGKVREELVHKAEKVEIVDTS